ncbi:MAG TPA: ornithine cyclodeaminase family protein [Jatrophihabitans sp.]|jgi:ornithine cyclodeaminase
MRTSARLRLLDGDAVAQLLTPDEVMSAVRTAFTMHSQGAGRGFSVVRERLGADRVFGIKSGHIPAQSVLGFKAAGFWPGNRGQGGDPHQATIMLIDPETGRPTCLLDGNAITSMRTGAAGGLGASLFSRTDSERLCVFGTGVQARVQVRFALRSRPALREVRYVSSDGCPRPEFESLFAEECDISHAPDADAAVSASDIIITATPGGGQLFAADSVREGTHLTCVGADTKGKRELPPGLIERSRVFVDDLLQASQLGELQWATPPTPAVEIGSVLDPDFAFQRTGDDITIFDVTGLALQDLTVSADLYQRAIAADVGTTIPWPW